MRLFKKLRRKLDYLDDGQIERIHDAYLLAHKAHRGQKRNTGEPYLTHPVAVAGILADSFTFKSRALCQSVGLMVGRSVKLSFFSAVLNYLKSL